MSDDKNCLLIVNGIGKSCDGKKVLDAVSFDIRAGEIHALTGENGIGKSLLSRILSGNVRPDEGTVVLEGQPTVFSSEEEALSAGILLAKNRRQIRLHPLSKVILLDETSAFLGEEEKAKLYATVRDLKRWKTGVLLISHNMDEIFELADRVTVLKDGKCAGTFETDHITRAQLVALI